MNTYLYARLTMHQQPWLCIDTHQATRLALNVRQNWCLSVIFQWLDKPAQ